MICVTIKWHGVSWMLHLLGKKLTIFFISALSKRNKEALSYELREVVQAFRDSFSARFSAMKRKHKRQLKYLSKIRGGVIQTYLWTDCWGINCQFLVRKTRPTVEKMRIYDTLKYSPIISCPGRARFNRKF